MNIQNELIVRSGGVCELCGSAEDNDIFAVLPETGNQADDCAWLCSNCRDQISGSKAPDSNHWRCLSNSMWSEFPAVQVLAWRMLSRLKNEGWAQDLLDALYLEDETLTRAQKGLEPGSTADDAVRHTDSNGAVLLTGDTVVLIKDLDVKGAHFIAKRGTAVKNISVVADNPEQIEGKVNGQQIVILTKFVKKA